ncbi:hypothetical protein HO133_003508 [Letharia lupina]|uniref:Uncharacterized protein n=1 Tax=Letharia lupina TaxID=560253 RepID=A0A8H6CBW3_9LECA|nr:uncharacterized protein HO133_003508 [Letharia lupina]KAF6220376.1 hypothetical protein HO133_003508 [Letharia lupina]
MSSRQPEERSQIGEHAFNPRLGRRHPDQLAPMIPWGQHEHEHEHYDPLPSISPYSMDFNPQYTPSTDAHAYKASPHVSADPALYLPYQSSFPQQSACEGRGRQQPSPNDGYKYSQRQSLFADNAVAYPQHSFHLSLSTLTDQSHHQQASQYYGQIYPQQPHQSSSSISLYPLPQTQYYPYPFQSTSSAAAYPSPQTQHHPYAFQSTSSAAAYHIPPIQHHPYAFQSTSSAAAYPIPPIQQAPPIFSDSPNEHYASPSLSDSPAPQGNRSGRMAGLRRESKKKPIDSRAALPDSQPNASASQLSHSSSTRPSKLSTRAKARVGQGELPKNVTNYASADTPLDLTCPLCKGGFAKRDHVKSHFPACVKRNGNPVGLRWNDGLPLSRRGPRASCHQVGREDGAGVIFR